MSRSILSHVEPAGLLLANDDLGPVREAKRLLERHGAQEAWRILTAQALDEHLASRFKAREATLKVLATLRHLAEAG